LQIQDGTRMNTDKTEISVRPRLSASEILTAPAGYAVSRGWHRGQTKLLVLPVLIFSTAVPQTGQGCPSR